MRAALRDLLPERSFAAKTKEAKARLERQRARRVPVDFGTNAVSRLFDDLDDVLPVRHLEQLRDALAHARIGEGRAHGDEELVVGESGLGDAPDEHAVGAPLKGNFRVNGQRIDRQKGQSAREEELEQVAQAGVVEPRNRRRL